MTDNEPFVSIVTPVYNRTRFLRDCIESVFAQQHTNWEYIIVNNCSTDDTFAIADSYAARDPRIRVHCNAEFVNADANHNIAFSLISSESKYCKVVFADDWLEPHCICRLVQAAETHPTAGIVGSYQRSGTATRWTGLPPELGFMTGKEIARRSLARELDVLGAPTSVLYRADLVRKRKSFFPHTEPHADTSVCFEVFKEADFAFVHEVLSHERLHDSQVSTGPLELSAGIPAHIEIIKEYGAAFLDTAELNALHAASIRSYYRWLGGCVLKLEGRQFWRFHSKRLRDLGLPVRYDRVLFEAAKELCAELSHPIAAIHKAAMVVSTLRRRISSG